MPSLFFLVKGGFMKKRKIRKQLDLQDRMIINACLNSKMNFTDIGKRLDVDKSTISREVRRNSYTKNGEDRECGKKINGLCNKCKTACVCRAKKRYYDCFIADKKSKERASNSRNKIKLPAEIVSKIDEVVSPGVKKGQSLHHVYIANPELQNICSERTIRRFCYRGILSIRPHELRRYVRFYHRLKKETSSRPYVREIKVLIGRTYVDYSKKVRSNPTKNVIQLDSVMGAATDKKAILTITLPKYGLQFGRLIRKNNPNDVNRALKSIFKEIGSEKVKKIFPIILADNGIEFSYLNQIEFDDDGEKICSTYFTNPNKPTDKACCERLHELVRYVLPKGKSLDGLTQGIVNEIFSNINSYVRESQSNKTPYELVKKRFGKQFLDKIGIFEIEKKKVRLLELI